MLFLLTFENSNPGILIAARPAWAGRLLRLKERKASTAGLILILEMTDVVRNMLSKDQSRLIVAGHHRICHLWGENNPATVCRNCQTLGHSHGECKNSAVCAFCGKDHPTIQHVRPVITCRKKGVVCKHVKRMCLLCHSADHCVGHHDSVAVKAASTTPSDVDPATRVVADPTSISGVSDVSHGRLRRQALNRPGTPLCDTMITAGVSKNGISTTMMRSVINPDRSLHNREVQAPADIQSAEPSERKGKGVGRSSPSAPADVSHGENSTVSQC